MRPVQSLIFPDFLFLKGLLALPPPKTVPGYREKLIFSWHCIITGSNAVLLKKCLVLFVSGNLLTAFNADVSTTDIHCELLPQPGQSMLIIPKDISHSSLLANLLLIGSADVLICSCSCFMGPLCSYQL